MFEIACNIFCFVTATMSFLFATRFCWSCGNKFTFEAGPAERKKLIKEKLPIGFAFYSFGFFIIFSCFFDGAAIISAMSITSAIVLSHFVVSMAMPELRRLPSKKKTETP